jgi:hypothetical protein
VPNDITDVLSRWKLVIEELVHVGKSCALSEVDGCCAEKGFLDFLAGGETHDFLAKKEVIMEDVGRIHTAVQSLGVPRVFCLRDGSRDFPVKQEQVDLFAELNWEMRLHQVEQWT